MEPLLRVHAATQHYCELQFDGSMPALERKDPRVPRVVIMIKRSDGTWDGDVSQFPAESVRSASDGLISLSGTTASDLLTAPIMLDAAVWRVR